MADTQTDPAFSIGHAELDDPVRQALGSAQATVLDYEVHTLHGGYGSATGGVFRLTGRASIPEVSGPAPWSLVLKVLRPSATGRASQDLTALGYWRREPLLYRSGLLEHLGPGLSAPRCFGVQTRGEEEWLWLEALVDSGGSRATDGRWPLSRYALVARHLGMMQAAYLSDRPLPDHPWLCRGKLRTWTGLPAGGIKRLQESTGDDPVRRYWPGDRYDRLLRLWDERGTFLDALDHAPQTFTHGDFKRDNLLARHAPGSAGAHDTQPVAIDWSSGGIGAAGSDTATLVAMSAIKPGGRAMSELPELDTLVFDAYAEGLRQAGWHGDLRPIRIAQSAALAMEAGFLVHAAMPASDTTRARRERAFGLPHDEFLERMSQTSAFALDVADNVRPLIT